MRRLLLPLCLMLGACMPATPSEVATRSSQGVNSQLIQNPFPVSGGHSTRHSNSDLQRDFLDLTFELENGRALPVFTRFEGPISVRLEGRIPGSLSTDLNRLLSRFRNEAGLDIFFTKAETANIHIHAVPSAEIRATLPQAACFVVPNVTSLAEFRLKRRTSATNWSSLSERTTVSVFVPSDGTPQELRDCLHEEFAQSLGPLNDLYRLPFSVFNDDNVHTVLTSYDMLILRAIYSDELRSGMTRAEVAKRLPSIFARINPVGNSVPATQLGKTHRQWKAYISKALGGATTNSERFQAAQSAVNFANQAGWRDHRLGFSYYVLARLMQLHDSGNAEQMFMMSDAIFRQNRYTGLHSAYVATQLASYAIADGRGEDALIMLAPHIDNAYKFENASLLATLMFLRAEATEMTGRVNEARTIRLDSLAWARYGFGSDTNMNTKLREIHALNPLKRNDG